MINAITSASAFFRDNLTQFPLHERVARVAHGALQAFEQLAVASVEISVISGRFLHNELTNFFIHTVYGHDVGTTIELLKNAGIVNPEIHERVYEHQDPKSLLLGIAELRNADILTEAHVISIAKHRCPSDLAKAFAQMQRNEILTDEYKQLVIKSSIPSSLAYSLQILKTDNILNAKNATLLAQCSYPGRLDSIFKDLKPAVLTPENVKLMDKSQQPIKLGKALNALDDAAILTHENAQLVAESSDPIAVADAFIFMKNKISLEDSYTKFIAKNRHPMNAAILVVGLIEANFSSDQIELILKEQHPSGYALDASTLLENFKTLKEFSLLTPDNIRMALKFTKPDLLRESFTALNKEGLLTQQNALFLGHCWNSTDALRVFKILKEASLTLNTTAIDYHHVDPNDAVKAILILDEAKILNDTNLSSILTDENPVVRAESLASLIKLKQKHETQKPDTPEAAGAASASQARVSGDIQKPNHDSSFSPINGKYIDPYAPLVGCEYHARETRFEAYRDAKVDRWR